MRVLASWLGEGSVGDQRDTDALCLPVCPGLRQPVQQLSREPQLSPSATRCHGLGGGRAQAQDVTHLRECVSWTCVPR